MELMILAVLNVVGLAVFVRGAVRSAVGFFRLVLTAAALVGIAAGAVFAQRVTGEDLSPVVAVAIVSVSALTLALALATVKFLTVAAAAAIGVMHGRKAMALRNEVCCMSYDMQYSSYADGLRKEIARHEEIHDATSSWLYSE